MTTRIFPEDWERLSAYLDGQVSEREREEIRLKLEAQPELQRALEELRRTKMVLHSAPRRRVPHNFTLTPAMLPQRKPWFRLVPVFSFASAVALILLVFSIGFSLLPGMNNANQLAAQAPAASTAPQRGALTAAQAPTQEAGDQAGSSAQPPVIVWAPPLGMGGGGSPNDTPIAGGMGGVPVQSAGGKPTLAPATGETPAAPEFASPASVPTETPAPNSQATPAAPVDSTQKSAPLSGSGPILGVRPTDDMGKIVVDQGADQVAYSTEAAPAAAQPETFISRNLTAIQIGLLVLALGAGLAAFLLRRRS